MLWILYYCLKVICCSSILFGYYRLALCNHRFHEWNRYYLLTAVFLSFSLPLIHIPVQHLSAAGDTPLILRSVQIISGTDEYVSELNGQQGMHITWPLLLALLYVGSLLFLGLRFFKNIERIRRLKQLYPCEFVDGIRFYNTKEPGTPFSFFKSIFWNNKIELNSEKGQQMLQHELAHVQEKHSTDKIFMELVLILSWWNPFFYLFRREISVIHELIADQKASAGDENLQYASLLLQKAMGSDRFAISNPFFHSQLKRRLYMLTTVNNPKFSYLRRLLVLPLMGLALVLFSFKYKELKEKELLKSNEKITVVIDPGHGGADNGATGANGLKEDNLVLEIAKQVQLLSAGTNIRIILTRDADTLAGNVSNKEQSLKYRSALAKASEADFFISLHLNSAAGKNANESGILAYVSNNNGTTGIQSRMLASALLEEFTGKGLAVASDIKTSLKHGIYVLDKNATPSVLLELGYISNPSDAAYIHGPKNQVSLATDILNAIAKHGEQILGTTAIADDGQAPKSITIIKTEIDAEELSLPSKKADTYKGGRVQSVTATADATGYVVKVDKEKLYNVDNQSVQKELNISKQQDRPASGRATGSNSLHADTATKRTSNFDLRLADSTRRPLFVIGGVVSDQNALNELNPSEIKSVTVLKGESSIAKYGDKGRNGVIEIELKTKAPAEIL